MRPRCICSNRGNHSDDSDAIVLLVVAMMLSSHGYKRNTSVVVIAMGEVDDIVDRVIT